MAAMPNLGLEKLFGEADDTLPGEVLENVCWPAEVYTRNEKEHDAKKPKLDAKKEALSGRSRSPVRNSSASSSSHGNSEDFVKVMESFNKTMMKGMQDMMQKMMQMKPTREVTRRRRKKRKRKTKRKRRRRKEGGISL